MFNVGEAQRNGDNKAVELPVQLLLRLDLLLRQSRSKRSVPGSTAYWAITTRYAGFSSYTASVTGNLYLEIK